ncbi:hypothetical protein XENTR_v10018828 [Xenopus tropicalis]|nr:hypothetical protein XENTR_v10018828 [Xenopus tropicalis]
MKEKSSMNLCRAMSSTEAAVITLLILLTLIPLKKVLMAENVEERQTSNLLSAWINSMQTYRATIQNNRDMYLTSYPFTSELFFETYNIFNPGNIYNTITTYRNTEGNLLSVGITIEANSSTYILCSNGNGSLILQRGELPKNIIGTVTTLLFYQETSSVETYSFRSADGNNQYLCYNTEDRAVLKNVTNASIDETCHMTISNQSSVILSHK